MAGKIDKSGSSKKSGRSDKSGTGDKRRKKARRPDSAKKSGGKANAVGAKAGAARAAVAEAAPVVADGVRSVVAGVVDRVIEVIAPEPVEPTLVDLWVDPLCPWAWLTSRWLLEVETVRPVRTVFHVMSLAVLDEINDVPAERRRSLEAGWAPVRVMMAVERQYGQEQLAAFYTALGLRFHPRGEPRSIETIAAALGDVGLPPELVEVGYSGDDDDALRASHRAGMDPVGYTVGTPVVHVGGVAWFGPVVTPRPSGEAAGELFDAVLKLASYPGFYELKRTRTSRPVFDPA